MSGHQDIRRRALAEAYTFALSVARRESEQYNATAEPHSGERSTPSTGDRR